MERTKQTDHERLLAPKDVAAYLSCSRSYVAQLLAEGKIPSLKVGGLRRIRKSDLDSYIEARAKAGD